MRMGYILYNTKNMQKDLVKQGKDSVNDMQVALNQAAIIMERVLREATPNSKTSGRSWQPQAANNRKKWGVLRQAVGKYKTRRLKSTETAGVNVGYLPSKRKKAFVAVFQNRGAYNAVTHRLERYHSGYIQRAEKATIPALKLRYAQVLGERITGRLIKFNERWSNKL